MEPLEYRDFEIEIGVSDGTHYPVAVLHSPSGQARTVTQLPFDRETFDQQLAALEDAILDDTHDDPAQVVEDFGSQLFDALIREQVRSVYDRSRQATADQGQGLRIKLRINAPELATIPWEYLYDPRQGEFVALSRYTPIVRYLELPLPDPEMAVEGPLRILGMVSSPSDVESLDVEREKARLEDAVREMQESGLVELVWLEGQTWRDLQAAMQGGPWHIFHFIGHAVFDDDSGEGYLHLADDDGYSSPLSATQLGRLLADHHTLRLTLLNACEGARGHEQSVFSSTASVLVQRGLPAVLAMQYEISDQAAIEFTSSFYGALIANLPVDAAVSEARKAISLAEPESMEWGTPALFMRAPDGVIWTVKKEEAAIGGRNLMLPILAAPVLVLIVIGILVYPMVKPLWNPAQMTGQFRIAVAEFGELDSDGNVRRSENGQVLSQWLFEALHDEYQQNTDLELARSIQVWHDSRNDTEQNFKFGIMAGDTAAERQASAARLAERVGAHMVIFGNLAPEGESQDLDLEFYLSPQVNDETASIIGPHRLGKPIRLPVPFDTDSPEVSIAVGQQIEVRSDALFWLTMGLTQQVLGRSDEALETFGRAEEELSNWPENDGKELLYFFIGREELFLSTMEENPDPGRVNNAEASFRKALDIDPAYARAQVALGTTYLQRAQSIPPEARLQEPRYMEYLEEALDHHLKGLELALATEEPLIEAVARILLASSYRLLGEAHYLSDSNDEAVRHFDLAIAEIDQAAPLLADTRQYRLLAQAYEAQGDAYLQQGVVLGDQGRPEDSRARLELAKTAYQSCISQGDKAFYDEILRDKVIEQGCVRYSGVTDEYLKKLEGE